jgi:hypothetical protein
MVADHERQPPYPCNPIHSSPSIPSNFSLFRLEKVSDYWLATEFCNCRSPNALNSGHWASWCLHAWAQFLGQVDLFLPVCSSDNFLQETSSLRWEMGLASSDKWCSYASMRHSSSLDTDDTFFVGKPRRISPAAPCPVGGADLWRCSRPLEEGFDLCPVGVVCRWCLCSSSAVRGGRQAAALRSSSLLRSAARNEMSDFGDLWLIDPIGRSTVFPKVFWC